MVDHIGNFKNTATNIFADTNAQVTTQGRKHLVAMLGSRTFIETHVKYREKEWVDELNQLSDIARTHPHAAYCAYIHGLKEKWLYLARTTMNISDLLQPLEVW